MDYKNFVNIMDMANLSKEKTGLNNDIFISTRFAKHRPRLRVYKDTVGSPTVSILLDKPHAQSAGKKGLISERDLDLVREWIDLNYDVLIGYWNNSIPYTEDVLKRLRPISK